MYTPEEACMTPYLAPSQEHYTLTSHVNPSGDFTSVVSGVSPQLSDGPVPNPYAPCTLRSLLSQAGLRSSFDQKEICHNCSRMSSVVKKK